jgi:hypothetical protein
MVELRKRLKRVTPNTRPLEFVEETRLSELTERALENPNSPDAKIVVEELVARRRPIPRILQKHRQPEVNIDKTINEALETIRGKKRIQDKQKAVRQPLRNIKPVHGPNPEPRTVKKLESSSKQPKRKAAPRARKQPLTVDEGFPTGPKQPKRRSGTTRVGPDKEPIPRRKPTPRDRKQPLTVDEGFPTGPKRKDASRASSLLYDPYLQQTTPDVGADTTQSSPKNVSAGRGTSPGNKGYETMREYFVEDLTPRKSKVKTPLGIIDIDTKEDMDAETRDILEMAQKKGGRLRKGKIKTSTRKRAALRGHRAELRGS